MGEFYEEISENHAEWIKKQKVIFVASAPLDANGKVNVSPKGYDCFRVIGPNSVCYLEMTGSGIETQSHVKENGRITIMFCAFEGGPRIMRLFGVARVVPVGTAEFDTLFNANYTAENSDLFDATGKRALIMVDVYKVGTSCGFGVPFYDYKGARPTQKNYWNKKTEEQVAEYWVKKNTYSLDGLPGMRHPRMGSEWSNGPQNVVRQGKGWWELGSGLTNVSLVAVGVGVGAALTSFALSNFV